MNYLYKFDFFKIRQRYPFHKTRAALTLIELIFVVIVVGILAAVALPKFAETAKNAKLAMDVSNMGTCLREASAYYAIYRVHLPLATFPSTCDNITCFTISSSDSNFTVTANSTADDHCTGVIGVGGHMIKSYRF